MTLDALPTLRETLEAHGLWARKSFGQHFLLDMNITRRIVKDSGVGPGDCVLEVGPGPGGLTRALLEAGVSQVIAVEKDDRFLPLLHELAAATPGRLHIINADALQIDETAILSAHGAGRATIVSNLPYNVGTPLYVRWLKAGAWRGSMTLMFQKEVAQRICAGPGDAGYGRLAVLTCATASASVVLSAPARAFVPPPRVESAVVHVTPLAHAQRFTHLGALERVTQAAFGQRRKMLRASLRALSVSAFGDPDALIARAGLDPAARPEDIAPQGFFALAAQLIAADQVSS